MAPRVELAGKAPEDFVRGFAEALLTIELDGEKVLKKRPIGEFTGSFADPGPEESPFIFPGECLFIAHKMSESKRPEGRPAGFFLPRGSLIRATIEGVPRIPLGVEVRVGGVGMHYGPDDSVNMKCGTTKCHTCS